MYAEFFFSLRKMCHFVKVFISSLLFVARLGRLADEMNMPSLPEMLFGDNVLRIQHTDGYGIEFNATDALKRVNNMEDAVKVACAQEWQESR